MAKKQWVNLPHEDVGAIKRANYVGGGVDSVDVMGREMYVEVEFDKKDANAEATLTVVPGGDNAAFEPEEAGCTAETVDKARVAADGKAKFKVRLSTAGGDTFTFKAKDASGTEKKVDGEVETWRKLYFQQIEMDGVTGLADFTFWMDEFKKDKRNIVLEEIKSKGKIDRVYNFDYVQSAYSQLFGLAKSKYSETKDPYCFALVWADCLAQGPRDKTLDQDKVTRKTGKVTFKIANGQLWKDIDKSATALGWKRGIRLEYRDKSNVLQKHEVDAADITSTYDQVVVDTKSLPEDVEGKLVADLRIAEGFHGGWSFTTLNIIVIATRGYYDKPFDAQKLKTIIVHEAGHKIGMVPKGSGALKKQSTLDEVHDTAAIKSHCSDKGCVMWWTTASGVNVFCSVCGKSTRKMPLYAPLLPGFKRFY